VWIKSILSYKNNLRLNWAFFKGWGKIIKKNVENWGRIIHKEKFDWLFQASRFFFYDFEAVSSNF